MNPFRRYPHFMGSVACLAMLPITIVLAGRDREPMVAITVTALYTTIPLPDGSRATLSRGSLVRYRPGFPGRRTLWLFGQGSFDVVPGTEFTLWTETALVTTAGARLSVTAAGRESTFVVVREGSARLRALNDDNDPAFPSVLVGAGGRAFAVRTRGVKLAR